MEKKLTCLLVEDDSAEQELFISATEVTQLPVQYKIAHTGREALELLVRDEWHPDIIFLDWATVTNTTGFVGALRETSSLSSIPILAFSNSPSDTDGIKALGTLAYCSRPEWIMEYMGLFSRYAK